MFATDEKSLRRDTEIQFFRASAPGGQNVNKRETGVRLHHIPSAFVVKIEDTRSQVQNTKIAFERLKERLEKANQPRKKRLISKRPPRVAREKRLQVKHVQSQKKQARQRPNPEA